MGADIHLYLMWDQKREDGERWWSSGWKLEGSRDYLMFGLLTNGEVRISEAKGYAPSPKGIPDHLPYIIEDDYAQYIHKDETADHTVCSRSDAERYLGYGGVKIFREDHATKTFEYYQGTGLPPDDEHWKISNPDWHTPSWLDLDELNLVLGAYQGVGERLWPNEEGAFRSYSPEWKAILAAMQALDIANCDPKLVMWFDN